MNLSGLRRDFGKNARPSGPWPDNPFTLFASWLQQAIDRGITEANAMVLATSGAKNFPSARVVLLKEFSEKEGFVFYTHYQSRKGIALSENPQAALHFFWRELEKQVSLEGLAEKLPAEKSDAYFNSRPRESRVSAIVSPQSRELGNPETLKKQWQNLYLSGHPLKRPENWGGYRFLPLRFEFWEGGEHRLHNRMVYTKQDTGWAKTRLAP